MEGVLCIIINGSIPQALLMHLPFRNNESERQSKSIIGANSIPHESEFQFLRREMIVNIFIKKPTHLFV